MPSISHGLQVNNLSSLENLKPGEKKQIKITLTNDQDKAEQVDLKLTNYSCNSEGQHFFDEDEHDINASIKASRSNATWINIGQNRFIMEPSEKRDIYYTITAPNDSTLKGSYWSVLLIEPAGNRALQAPSDDGFSLQIKIRYAHHIVTNFGEGAPKLKILKKEIKEIETKRYLCIHVLNEGDLFFNPTSTLKLYDAEGRLEKTIEAQSERLYPGNSQCFYLDLQGIPENRLTEKLNGFLLFDGKNDILFGDKFTYP